MKIFTKLALILPVAAICTACISPKSFVDPKYHKADYATIKRLASPLPTRVEIQFQRNGQPYPSVEPSMRTSVERTLRATGVFVPAPEAPVSTSLRANNIADLSASAAKGFGTGLTLGAVGSMHDDNYEFRCTFNDAGGRQTVLDYPHAMHTAIGNTEQPAGLTPMTIAGAFDRIVEEVVMNCVKDLQDAGTIPSQ